MKKSRYGNEISLWKNLAMNPKISLWKNLAMQKSCYEEVSLWKNLAMERSHYEMVLHVVYICAIFARPFLFANWCSLYPFVTYVATGAPQKNHVRFLCEICVKSCSWNNLAKQADSSQSPFQDLFNNMSRSPMSPDSASSQKILQCMPDLVRKIVVKPAWDRVGLSLSCWRAWARGVWQKTHPCDYHPN